MLFEQDVAAIDEHRSVHCRLPSLGWSGECHTGHHCRGKSARQGRQFVDSCAAASQKARLFKEIGRGVSANGKLGEDRESGPLRGGPAAGRDNFFKITGEISNSGIDLGQCDLHSSILVPGENWLQRPNA